MRLMRKKAAVSPVIATLLLIAIAVAAGIILYVFVSGLSGQLSSVRSTVTQPLQVTVASVKKDTTTGIEWEIQFIVTNPNNVEVTLLQAILSDNTGAQIQTATVFTAIAANTCPATPTTTTVAATTQAAITACFSSVAGLNSGQTYRLVVIGKDALGNQYTSNPAPLTLR